ncbi:hypothetical protein GmHk_08G024300 [Glycine max]|nr:hypothetical protein GmHk_08G024300 [Glycine max]
MIGNLSLVNAASSGSNGNFGVSYSYCGREDHTIEDCYRNNGFSSNFSSNTGGRGSQGSFGKGTTSGRRSKVCTHCDITDHIVEECYKKIGYLPGRKFYRPQGNSMNNAVVDTRSSVDNGTLLALIQQQSNATNPNSTTSSHTNQIGTFPSRVSVHIVVGNVTTCIVSKHDSVAWILDSGATNHVAFCLSLYSSYKQIQPIIVKLPNGQ